ncbi:uncharacterized protein G2W53_019801 [Senna tora]|uniref:Uncharacterized protein n=1 Tax=Senna tora TaxID=362788 RepID=A0A834WMP9_9FABA|nr:uncharacterized protein G2W53_019801 [Senna tora]
MRCPLEADRRVVKEVVITWCSPQNDGVGDKS